LAQDASTFSLADRTGERSIISYWHDNVVSLFVWDEVRCGQAWIQDSVVQDQDQDPDRQDKDSDAQNQDQDQSQVQIKHDTASAW